MNLIRTMLLLPVVVMLVAGCSSKPTITSSSVVQQMQKVSRLETGVFTVQSVIEYESEKPDDILRRHLPEELVGESLLLIAQGKVVAGIDLSKLSEQDVTISEGGTKLTVRLPAVEILSVDMDAKNTRTYSHNRGLLAPENISLADEARVQAESRILATACEQDIMQFATDSSLQAMQQFLGMLDFETVEVIPARVPACPDEPPE
jgi:hypothetical protein